jgi:putative FmdB family regulatory protein
MPVYEYRCRDCGHEFEIQQSMSDDALTECPSCGGNLRKVFSPVGIAFKGSGFYKTDSKSSSNGGNGSSSSSGDSSSSSKESSTASASSSPD